MYAGCSYNNPRGYHFSTQVPQLRGENHCPYCLCAPCLIEQPPDFLVGSAGPHPANDEKRHMLYTKFWRLLADLCVWKDEEYIRRKQARTTRDDKREVMPKCVQQVL